MFQIPPLKPWNLYRRSFEKVPVFYKPIIKLGFDIVYCKGAYEGMIIY
jgi:energy-converting hydrogenase Eha subunit A